MNDLEKIIEMLDKDFMTQDEKLLLDDMIKDNPEAKKIRDAYLGLKNSLNRNEHIDEELMAEYVLYKNNLSSDGVIVFLSGKVEDHLRKCVQCEQLFTELNTEYCDIDSYVDQALTKPIGNKSARSETLSLFKSFSAVKYAFTAFAAIVVLYAGLFAVSSFTTPDYKKSFSEGEEFYTTRGRTSELFQRGLDAIDRKDYENAIRFLREDINNNRADGSIFYSHFVLGITYVNRAENDFLGLFRTFDKNDVKSGIDNFEKSITLNNSGKFDNLNLDAHYFIGKSYLMIDDINSARKHLQLVVDGKGSYYKKAEALLREL